MPYFSFRFLIWNIWNTTELDTLFSGDFTDIFWRGNQWRWGEMRVTRIGAEVGFKNLDNQRLLGGVAYQATSAPRYRDQGCPPQGSTLSLKEELFFSQLDNIEASVSGGHWQSPLTSVWSPNNAQFQAPVLSPSACAYFPDSKPKHPLSTPFSHVLDTHFWAKPTDASLHLSEPLCNSLISS